MSAINLSKDFNKLLERWGDYTLGRRQSPSDNLLAFADTLQQHQKNVGVE
ncbi:MAG: hypothetical protein IPM78_13225 [Moraxellaceae bacterium]|nr:hypothetical protein [Moraxellaceae bacterium]